MGTEQESIEQTNLETTLELQEIVEPKKELLSDRSNFEPIDFQRSTEEEKVWRKIRNSIKNDYELTSDGTSVGKLSKFGLRIEEDFKFSVEAVDTDFSPFHVELLLDQAADLLERGVRDRSTWDEQATKMFLLALELNEYMELDEIHKREEASGIYDVSFKQSEAEYQAEATNARWQGGLKSFVEKMLNNFYSKEQFDKQFNAARRLAWMTGSVFYRFKGQEFDSYVKHAWDGVEKTASEHSVEATEVQSEHSLGVQKETLALQQGFYDGSSEASKARLEGLEARSNWDVLNANFLRERTKVARKYQDIKSRAAIDSDGVLNYGKRLDALKELFHQDFRDALARLKVVQQGFKKIYDKELFLPTDESSLDYFDECLLWSRQAIQWLIKFSRAEQSIVLSISLRDILGVANWNKQRKQGILKVNMSKDLFIGMAHVRLRGLSAFVVGSGSEDKLWEITAKVPAIAKNKILAEKPKTLDLDQSQIPLCKLARVTSRNAQRDPDIFGVLALYNTSPIGKWTVQVLKSVPASPDFSQIEDIQLDLHLVFRSLDEG